MSGRRWVVALACLAGLTAVAAAALFLSSSAIQVQTDAYYSGFISADGSPTATEIDPDEDAYYNHLSIVGSNLWFTAGGMLTVTLASGMALLTVLAARRDQAGATAAS